MLSFWLKLIAASSMECTFSFPSEISCADSWEKALLATTLECGNAVNCWGTVRQTQSHYFWYLENTFSYQSSIPRDIVNLQ